MLKKTLIASAMVVFSVLIILSFVGWNRVSLKNEARKAEDKVALGEGLEEVRIVAVKEEAPPAPKKKERPEVPVKKESWRRH